MGKTNPECYEIKTAQLKREKARCVSLDLERLIIEFKNLDLNISEVIDRLEIAHDFLKIKGLT